MFAFSLPDNHTAAGLMSGQYQYLGYLYMLRGVGRIDRHVGNVVAGKGLDALLQEDIAHDNTITRRKMAIKHGVTEKTIERHLKGMGIRFEGASKTGHWVLPVPGTGK